MIHIWNHWNQKIISSWNKRIICVQILVIFNVDETEDYYNSKLKLSITKSFQSVTFQ